MTTRSAVVGSPWSHMSQEGSFSPSFSSYASPRGTPVSNSNSESCDAAFGELPVSSVPPPSLSDTETGEVQQDIQGAMRPHMAPSVPENAPAVLPAGRIVHGLICEPLVQDAPFLCLLQSKFLESFVFGVCVCVCASFEVVWNETPMFDVRAQGF